jgi:cytochrome c biogenesis protein CcdA
VDSRNWNKEETMALAGVVITFVGFIVAVASLGIASSNTLRMVIVLAGMGVSLFGILGLLNPAYMRHAIWKK